MGPWARPCSRCPGPSSSSGSCLTLLLAVALEAAGPTDWHGNAPEAYQEDMYDQQRDDSKRQQHDVDAEHLAVVEDVEEDSEAGPVDGVLAVQGDPLRVQVLLRQVTRKRGTDRDREDAHSDDPCESPAVSPASHEELTPQVDHGEGEEELHAPEVDAVDELAGVADVPPGGPKEDEDNPADDDPDQRRDCPNAEHVHPRRHIAGLFVRQDLLPGPA